MEFKISSALKSHIGKELITDDNVAVFELVKNSYDAGAKRVKIIFEDMKSDSKKIYIIDNGKGMSKQDIEEKWLFLGYSEKRDFKIDKRKTRLMAGEKGMGRFSADKLGSKLKIFTKTSEEKNFNVLELNWEDFEEDQKKEFQSIPVKTYSTKILEKGFDVIKNSGTVVEILGLRGEWDRDKLLRLKKYLQRLINPLGDKEGNEFKIFLEAEDFIVKDKEEKLDHKKINGKIENKIYDTLGLKTTTINCEISEKGDIIITNLDDKGIPIFELTEKNENFDLLKNIKVKLSFLNKIAKTTFSKQMGIKPVKYGNIFVFKNGFRVLPLGDYRNDWLGLDSRKGQGYARTLGTRELLGKVEINGYQEDFKEVLSREGLIHTSAYHQLTDFVIEIVLKRLEKYVIGAIDWDSIRKETGKKDFESIKKDSLNVISQIAGSLDNKNLKYNKNFLQIVERKEIEKIPEVIKNLENIIKKEKDPLIKDIYTQQVQSLKQGLKLQKVEISEKEKYINKIGTQNVFLKSIHQQDYEQLTSLFHRIGIHSDIITERVSELINFSKQKNPSEELINALTSINSSNNEISVMSKIGHKGGITKQLESKKQDLILFFLEYLENICKKYYDKIKIEYKNYCADSFIIRFKPFKLGYLIDNFISNSKKADAKNITFILKQKQDSLIMEVIDDGKGLDKKIEDKDEIFEETVSYTGGSGLGLYDTKQILKEIGGTIQVEQLDEGVKFSIEIKK